MTFGSLRRVDGGYEIDARPHVAMRLKRIFPRAQQNRRGPIVVADTLETSRDLEWVLERWPLDVDDVTAKHLEARAAEHRDVGVTVERILSGYEPRDLDAPAREPRPWQRQPVQIVGATGRLLLTDELGLGKTMSSLLALSLPDALPALAVTLTHLPRQWKREVEMTWPDLRVHMLSGTRPYELDRACRGKPPDVIISNYAKLAGWADFLAGTVRTVIFDECQELRRATSLKYEAACLIAEAARYRVGASATPVFNYGNEIFNIVSVLDPEVLGDWTEFVREWCWNYREVMDPDALGDHLRDEGVMLRRTRKEVGALLPGGRPIRVPHEIDIDDATYEELTADAVGLARAITNPDRGREAWQASGQFDMAVRQATGIAKAPYVAKFVEMLLEAEPVVLYGWHHAVYDVWRDLLGEHRPAFYTGRESPNQKDDAARRFLEGDTDLLVMSLRSGAGLDGLQERAHVCVFGELDWSPGMHDQGIGRLHRDGQDEPVVAYFLIASSGADPVMADVLNLKRQQSDPINDPERAEPLAVDADPDHVRKLAEAYLAQRQKGKP